MIPRHTPNYGLGALWQAAGLPSAPGPCVDEVAALLRAELGLPHVLPAPSGRGALRLLLRALPPPFAGGRVVVPAYTCSAVVESARLAGREVVQVEHHAGGLNLGPADLAATLRPGDVLIATHQYGYPCEIEALCAAASRAGAAVLEDIAAAFGQRIGGRPAGSFGLACFGSFDASKLLHTPPKGGFAATADAELAARLAHQAEADLVPFGAAGKARALAEAALLVTLTRPALYGAFHALNFRLRGRVTAEDGKLAAQPNAFYTAQFAEWQAAILLPQLRGLPALLARRRVILETYRARIGATGRFAVERAVVEEPGAVIRFPLYAREDKLALHRELLRQGVDTGFSFTTIAAPAEARHAWSIARSVLNLPLFARLTEAEVEQVVRAALGAATVEASR